MTEISLQEKYLATSSIVEAVNAWTETDAQDIEAKLGLLVTTYRGFAKDTATSCIKMCKLVVEADETLPKWALDRFCKQVKLDRNSSTYRKIKKIGESADRLLQFADLLPHNWTTLYQLALKEPDELRRLAENGILHPAMTAADLRQATPGKCALSQFIIKLDVTSLPQADRLSLAEELELLGARFGITIKGLPAKSTEALQ